MSDPVGERLYFTDPRYHIVFRPHEALGINVGAYVVDSQTGQPQARVAAFDSWDAIDRDWCIKQAREWAASRWGAS